MDPTTRADIESGDAITELLFSRSNESNPIFLTQTRWFIDPVNGKNTNPGSLVEPIKGFAEIVRRWGTDAPNLRVKVQIQWLNDGGPDDPVQVNPTFIGGGGLVLSGTPVPLDTVTLGTYTAKDRVAGTKATITAQGKSGAYWTPFVGKTIHTSSGAQFFVDADLGAATAAITEPMTYPVLEIPTRHTIANGDVLHIFDVTEVYFANAGNIAYGNATGNGFQITQLTVRTETEVQFQPLGFQEVIFKTIIGLFAGGTDSSSILTSCYVPATYSIIGVMVVFGGSCFNQPGSNLLEPSWLDYDAIVNLRPHFSGAVGLATAYFAQWFTDTGARQGFGTYIVEVFSSTPDIGIWGPAQISVTNSQQMALRNGITAVGALLCTGGLRINNSASAWTFNDGTGAFSAGPVVMSPAGLDAAGSYQDPRTGARIYIQR